MSRSAVSAVMGGQHSCRREGPPPGWPLPHVINRSAAGTIVHSYQVVANLGDGSDDAHCVKGARQMSANGQMRPLRNG
jgi:hypothetical protein